MPLQASGRRKKPKTYIQIRVHQYFNRYHLLLPAVVSEHAVE